MVPRQLTLSLPNFRCELYVVDGNQCHLMAWRLTQGLVSLPGATDMMVHYRRGMILFGWGALRTLMALVLSDPFVIGS